MRSELCPLLTVRIRLPRLLTHKEQREEVVATMTTTLILALVRFMCLCSQPAIECTSLTFSNLYRGCFRRRVPRETTRNWYI
jgi:hypothetical protein